MPRNPKIEFDMLQMYCGEPYVIDLPDTIGSITVYSPTIGDVISAGEKKFYETLNIFICNTTQYRLPLWDNGIDWTQISDFELFAQLYHSIDSDISKMLFGDLDFSKFQPLMKRKSADDEKGELILWNEDSQVEINQDVYNHFSQYLQNVFSIFPEEKITKDDILKTWYINKDRRALKNAQEAEEKGKKHSYSIQALISACINHPGFKYKLKDLKEVGVCEFYDSVRRLQIYEQSTALMKGMYSGFVDGSKIDPNNYNFMRES